MVALRTADAEAAARDLRARGIAAGESIRFSRPVDTPAGRAEAGFVVALIAGEATPGTATFVCQHLTSEYVWLPELRRHPNTAARLDSVTVLVDDPAAVVEPYAALFGARGVVSAAADDGGYCIAPEGSLRGAARISRLSWATCGANRASQTLRRRVCPCGIARRKRRLAQARSP